MVAVDRVRYGLEGKVVLVTGGLRGIGLATARRFREQGCRVAICARKAEGLSEAERQLAEAGGPDGAEGAGAGGVLAVAAHIAEEDQVERLLEAVLDRFGRLDILVNNVGMNLMTPSVVDADVGAWWEIGLAARLMREQKGGKIISVSSTAARKAAPAMGIYGVAKATWRSRTGPPRNQENRRQGALRLRKHSSRPSPAGLGRPESSKPYTLLPDVEEERRLAPLELLNPHGDQRDHNIMPEGQFRNNVSMESPLLDAAGVSQEEHEVDV